MEKTPRSLQKPNSQTDFIAKTIMEEYTLFHDQNGNPFIATEYGGSSIIALDSEEFKNWLNSQVFQRYGTILKYNQQKDISFALKSMALFCGSEKKLETRICFDGKDLWYDLGKSAVRINGEGWKIIVNPPILFRRYKASQESQVIPEQNGDLQRFRKFVNIPDECDWLLFMVFTVCTFIPDFPKPILVLNGSQGAGKTTPMRYLKKLADPSILQSCDIPKGTDELARIANRHTVLFFDNLSKIPSSVSDDLCRIITGGGFSKRTAYTNDGETIYTFKRAIMMNGINSFITQADLLDRSLLLEVERIPEDKRLPEEELNREFDKERPYILGGIFDILSKAIKIYPSIKLDSLPRMADFAKWGYAITESIEGYSGEDFVFAYEENRKKQDDEAIQANPVATAITLLLKNSNEWKGTASEFFDIFDSESGYEASEIEQKFLHRNAMWPKDPSGIGRAIRRAEANLKAIGIIVEKKKENNKRILHFYREDVRQDISGTANTAKLEEKFIQTPFDYSEENTSTDNEG